MNEDDQPLKKNSRWRSLTTAWVWGKIKERRSSDRITKTVFQRVVSSPAVVGLAASATVVGAASGIGLISGNTDVLERRIVVLEQQVQNHQQLNDRVSQLEIRFNDLLNQTEINTSDIQNLQKDLATFKVDLEALSSRVSEVEVKLDKLIEDFSKHFHSTTTTTIPTTTTTVPTTTTTVPTTTTTVPTTTTTVPTTTTTVPTTTTTTVPPKGDPPRCKKDKTKGEGRKCSQWWDWLQFRLAAWLD